VSDSENDVRAHDGIENENEAVERAFLSRAGQIAVACLLFFPATIAAVGFHFVVMRWLRQKWTVAVMIATLLSVCLLFGLRGVVAGLQGAGFAYDSGEFWWGLLWLYVLLGALVGVWAGMVPYPMLHYQLRVSPHIRELKGAGDWKSRFSYRRAPWEAMNRRARMKALKAGMAAENGSVPLGVEEPLSDNPLSQTDEIVARTPTEANLGMVMTGGSGAGKTTTLKSMLYAEVSTGSVKHIAYMDLKGDKALAADIAAMCKENGYQFYHVSQGRLNEYDIPLSDGMCSYDPLATGGVQRAGTVLNLRVWTEESDKYRSDMQEFLNALFTLFDAVDPKDVPLVRWERGMVQAVEDACNIDAFRQLVDAAKGTDAYEAGAGVYRKLSRGADLAAQASAVAGKMRALSMSAFGPHLSANPYDYHMIDIARDTADDAPPCVILFTVPSGADKETARTLGALFFSDMARVMDHRQRHGEKSPLSLYCDEFQEIPITFVTPLLEKGRSAGLRTTLAAQSFSHIVTAAPGNGEAYLTTVCDTISSFLVCSGAGGDSAERVAGIAGKGKRAAWRRTNDNQTHMFSLNFLNRKNQNVTEDASEDWFTPPELFTRLVSPKPDNGFRSEAVYLVKGGAPEGVGWRERRRRKREAGSTGGVWVRKVRLIPPDQVLGDSYNKAAADRALAVNVARFEEIRAAVGGTASSPVVNAPLDAPAGGGQAGSSGRKRRGKRGGRAHGGGQSSPGSAPESGAPTGGVASASPAGGLPGTRPAGSSTGGSPVAALPGVPVGGLPGTVPAGGSAGSAPAGPSPAGGSAGGAPVRRGLRR
jgi:HN1